MRGGIRGVGVFLGLLLAAGVTAISRTAAAVEPSFGVSVGGLLIGTVPHLSVSPHGSLAWRWESGFQVAVHEMCNVLIPRGAGPGVYNQTSGAIGYASDKYKLSLGPSLSLYVIPACGVAFCGRVLGLAAGARAQVDVYFTQVFGLSTSASVDWVGGRSLVLPGSAALTLLSGPALRWIRD